MNQPGQTDSPQRGPAGDQCGRRCWPVLFPLLVFFLTGVWGIDFGRHWDEPLMLRLVQAHARTGSLLPFGFYNYPSLCYDLGMAAALPDRLASRGATDPQADLQRRVNSPAFHLRLRLLFLALSTLTLLWLYLLALAWGRSRAEAFLASAFLAGAWEVAYHARWIAPDALLMQFGALTMLCAMRAWFQPPGAGWLAGAAVAAGLGFSTKYPGALLALPVVAAAYRNGRLSAAPPAGPADLLDRRALLLVLGCAGLCLATYLAASPGTLLEYPKFTAYMAIEREHYRTGHYGYTVPAGLGHLGRMLVYLGAVLFSPYRPVAAIMAALALGGAVSLCRRSPAAAAVYLLFPLLYLAYMATQRVMIVRNLLVVAPFLALLAARGAVVLWEALPPRGWRWSWAAALGVMLAFNFTWLVRSAASIHDRSPQQAPRQLAAYLAAHPADHILLSARARQALIAAGLPVPPNATADPSLPLAAVAFYPVEGRVPHDWPANDPDLTLTWFGSDEVNFNYYATWEGDERIVLMRPDRAREMGIDLRALAR
jgi:4-amino-4-deoxy-L-arabinose transferase-like glycosyltransferase